MISNLLFLCLLCGLTWSACNANDLGGIADPTHRLPLFHSYDVVEDVIPIPPLAVTQVIFQNGQTQLDIPISKNIAVAATSQAPKVKFPLDSSSNNFYSLFMVDPDAPSRANPVAAQWLHWCILNVDANDLQSGWMNNESDAGELKVAYSGPNPPPASGDHRYVILIYSHSTAWTWDAEFIDSRTAKGRAGFNVQEYVDEQDQNAQLVSGTFWLAHAAP